LKTWGATKPRAIKLHEWNWKGKKEAYRMGLRRGEKTLLGRRGALMCPGPKTGARKGILPLREYSTLRAAGTRGKAKRQQVPLPRKEKSRR